MNENENVFEKNYSTYNGTILEYSTTEDGTYSRIYGLRSVPDIGGEPNTIDTTDLDNTEYETSMYGLKPAQNYTLEFNMQNPAEITEANIKICDELENSGLAYYFRIIYTNGIKVAFKSKVKTTILGGNSGDLLGYQVHLSPMNELKRTITDSTSL